MKELLFLSAVKNRAIIFHFCFYDIPQWPNTNFGWLCFQRFPVFSTLSNQTQVFTFGFLIILK